MLLENMLSTAMFKVIFSQSIARHVMKCHEFVFLKSCLKCGPVKIDERNASNMGYDSENSMHFARTHCATRRVISNACSFHLVEQFMRFFGAAASALLSPPQPSCFTRNSSSLILASFLAISTSKLEMSEPYLLELSVSCCCSICKRCSAATHRCSHSNLFAST